MWASPQGTSRTYFTALPRFLRFGAPGLATPELNLLGLRNEAQAISDNAQGELDDEKNVEDLQSRVTCRGGVWSHPESACE